MNNNLKMILVLFCVCIFSAFSLSFLYTYTKPRIEKNKILKEQKLKTQLIPNAENFVSKEIKNFGIVEECYDKSQNLLGILLKSSCRGYGGDIEYIVGITAEINPKILSLKILSHKETPGLGANVEKEKFLSQFKDKNSQEIVLKKDNPLGKIDAISGATITSRTITSSLRNLLEKEELKEYLKSKEKKIVPEEQVLKQQVKQKPKVEQQNIQKIFVSTTTEETQ
jgi:electron transport complex protein RnfG